MVYVLVAVILWGFAFMAWIYWLRNSPPKPVIYVIPAAIASGLAVWRLIQARKKIRNLKLGRDGEKAVGQFLERLRTVGAQVFHDIPGDGFNLDHVVIHLSGIYVIETKTHSVPEKGEPKIVYDGKSIRKTMSPPDSGPIIQARSARKWLEELIKESTGRTFPIRPVVVFPGWYIESTAEAKSSDVWVLNPKALPIFIEHSVPHLALEDVNLCAYHLSRYIRTAN
jgi:hypothetical protein